MVLRRFGVFDINFTGIIGKHIPIEIIKILGPASGNKGLPAAGIELVEQEVFFVREVVEVGFVMFLDVTVFVLNFEISALVLGEHCWTFNVAWAVFVSVGLDGVNDFLDECRSFHDRLVVAFDHRLLALNGSFVATFEAKPCKEVPEARLALGFGFGRGRRGRGILKFDNRGFVLRLVPIFRCMCVLDDPAILDAENTWGMAILECHSLLLRGVGRQPSLGTSIRAHTLSFETGGER